MSASPATMVSAGEIRPGSSGWALKKGSFMRAEIKPYRLSIGDDVLDDLKSRLRNTRWPEAEPVEDWSQGAPLKWIRDLPLLGGRV